MQIQQLPYMRQLLFTTRQVEQTQEVRLPEGMPDAENILGAWGQVLIRGKEWRSDQVGVSGGVTVSALYCPGEGPARVVEGWVPFQAAFDIPATDRDGQIVVNAQLQYADARCVSSRKILLRCGVTLTLCAYGPGEAQLWSPEQIPEEVAVKTAVYPVQIRSEVGEKQVNLEQLLEVNGPMPEKILHCRVSPLVTEQKVIAGRVVFRGDAQVHLLGRMADGSLESWEMSLPFSQYAQLEREHEEDACAQLTMAVTGLEADTEPGGFRVRCGLMGQYRIADTQVITVTEDAYCPHKRLTCQYRQLELPTVLESTQLTAQADAVLPEDCARLVDQQVWMDPAEQDGEGIGLSGSCQMLYYDGDGLLRGSCVRWRTEVPFEKGQDAKLELIPAQQSAGGSKLQLCLQADTVSDRGFQSLEQWELAEKEKPDPDRPSLILRRCGSLSLWELAKLCGSTREAIRETNGFSDEPDPDKWLLIPVV